MTGLFISFEGIDGVGKTTQVERMRQYVLGQGLHPTVTREPGGTPAGLAIRELLLHGVSAFPSVATAGGSDVVDEGDDLTPRTEALLYAADRAQHVAQIVRPALSRGDVVISDRYLDSSLAYQSGGRGLDLDEVRSVSMWAAGRLMPRRTYLLDMDPQQSYARLTGEPDRLEASGLEFRERTRRAFLELAAKEPDRFVVLDASRPVQDVWQDIQSDCASLLDENYSDRISSDGSTARHGGDMDDETIIIDDLSDSRRDAGASAKSDPGRGSGQ